MRHSLPALVVGLLLLTPLALGATTLINTISNATADEAHSFANFDVVSSAVADFNGDGKPEIVTQNDNKYVYVLDPRSTHVLAEWLPPYPSGWGARPLNDPSVADVDNDGALDVILVTSAGTVCDYEYGSGWTFTKRWCKTMDAYSSPGADAGAVVGDVNGDGRMEVFSQVETKGLYAFNYDGTVRWSKNEYGGNSGPLLTDLDGDGKKEVVFFSDGGKVRAYDASTGNSKWVFYASSYVNPGAIPVAGSAADLDGDGKKEIVFTGRDAPDTDSVYTDNHLMVFVINYNGAHKAHWQPPFGNPLSYTHPVLLDVDGDGDRDILLQDWNTIGHKPGNWERLGPANVFAYTPTGGLLWRTSLDNSWSNDDLGVADVDGDGKYEVLAIGYNGGNDGVWYLDLKTGVKEGHVPVGSGWQALRGPLMFDIDETDKTAWMISVSGNGGGWKVFKTDSACKIAFGGTQNRFLCGDADGSSTGGGGTGGNETPPPPPPPTGNFTFDPTGGNEWWTQLTVDPKPVAVEAMDTGGAWVALTYRDWGQWAGSFHIEPGHDIRFRASGGAGVWEESCWFTHPGGVEKCGSTTPPPPPPNGTFAATWKNVRGNEWWVETDVTVSGGTLSGVDARVDGGAWVALTHQSYGSWAKSLHAPPGSHVEFRARATDGQTATSAVYTWPPG
ncbi:MAG TPA: VCBS repeat-containing protein [Candidatus Thermoplasmatota archaeon]|nr:VCBS repeat-containing protein [Candidatus Thermoplasmatota archaeon]